MRITKPRDLRAAINRPVPVRYLDDDDHEICTSVTPNIVETLCRNIIKNAGSVLSVDRVAPPGGPRDVAYYDHCGGGPYWTSEL